MAAPILAANDIDTGPLAVDVDDITESEQGDATDPENPRDVIPMDALTWEESASPLQEGSVGGQGEPQNPQGAEAMDALPYDMYEKSDSCLQEGAVGGQGDDTDLQHPQSDPPPDDLPSERAAGDPSHPPGRLLYDPVYSQLSSIAGDSTLDGPEVDNLLIGAPGGRFWAMGVRPPADLYC